MHPSLVENVCSSQQISDYYASCLDSGTSSSTKCQSFTTANASCVACLVTPESAPSWGALIAVENGAILDINEAGCIAIVTGDSSSTSCAQKLASAIECDGAACVAQCPITDGSSFALFEQCLQSANAGGCSKFLAAECDADAGNFSQCIVTGSFQAAFLSIAPMFCSAP